VATKFKAKIETHKLTVITNKETIIRTEGTTTVENGTTHFEATLPNNERLILLFREGCCIGISLFDKNNSPVFTNDYYNL